MLIKKSSAIAGVFASAMVIGATATGADTVHDQSTFDINAFGWDSVAGAPNTQQIADDFQLSVDGKIAILNWTGKYHDNSVLEEAIFEVRVFRDAGGQPGEMVFSQPLVAAASDTGIVDKGAHKLLTYTATVNGSPIFHGTATYWLSIRESDPSTSATWSWSFHNSEVAGGYSYRRGAGTGWAVGTQDMAYSVSITPSK